MNEGNYKFLIPKIKEMASTISEALLEFKYLNEKEEFQKSQEVLNMCGLSLETILSIFEDNLKLNNRNIEFINQLINNFNALQTRYTLTLFTRMLEDIQYLYYFSENYQVEINTPNYIQAEEKSKKVMFVPYKASMWDSMDSIYKAAIKDEDCEVFVVPAPYYVIRDGNIDKYEYEGYDIDENVKIIHWQDPCIYNMKFDVIYFHNPYDSYNTVSRVHSNFHSNMLREWCEKLVFTPYAVGIDSFNTLEESKSMYIANMFKLPALQCADIVLVNSKCEKEFLEKQGISSQKLFRASPKLDYGVIIKDSIVNIPKEWSCKLDGKVVFLVGLNIKHLNEAYYKGVEIIKEILSDSDCALVFRPHPFLKAFIKNANLEMYKHFMNVLDIIKYSPNGIYDETTSYVTSFKVSHALFNDFSSIMPMYMMNEKPVYQYIEPHLNKENHNIDYTGAYGASQNISIKDFINLVKSNDDYKKEERLNKFYTSIGQIKESDMTDGERVHNHVMNMR